MLPDLLNLMLLMKIHKNILVNISRGSSMVKEDTLILMEGFFRGIGNLGKEKVKVRFLIKMK